MVSAGLLCCARPSCSRLAAQMPLWMLPGLYPRVNNADQRAVLLRITCREHLQP